MRYRIPSALLQHWQLFNVLFLPLPLARVLWWLSILLGSITLLLNVVVPLPVLVLLSTVCLGLSYMFSSALVFSQLLLLLSNRHLQFFDVRIKTLWVLLFFSVLMSLVLAGFLAILGHAFWEQALIFWSVFTCLILPGAFLNSFSHFLGPIIIGFGSFIFARIMNVAVRYEDWLFAVDLVIWCFFSAWWCQFRPTKKYTNFAMNSVQFWHKQTLLSDAGIGQTWFSHQAKSYVGSALLGCADGVRALIKRIAVIYAALSGFIILLAIFLESETLETFFRNIGLWVILLVIVAPNISHSTSVMRNLARVWLLFPGDRLALFLFAEKLLWSASLLWYLPFIVLWFIAGFFLDFVFSEWWLCILFLLVACSLQVTYFYFSCGLYRCKQCHFEWKFVLFSLPMIAVLLCGFVIARLHWTTDKIFAVELALWSAALLFLLAFIVRSFIVKSWTSIDFVRMKS